jgi:hypothetical protein
MSNIIEITRSESDTKGRYVAHIEGHDGVGELTYSRISPTKIIAEHTGVNEKMRGMGVASALVDRLVTDARTEGVTIVPLCPFVKAQYRKHPEWSDVMDS